MTVKAAAQCLAIVLIWVVLAPSIGGFAFFVIRAAIDLVTSGLEDIKGLFVIVMLGAYAVGGPIALLAGLFVATINLRRIPILPIVVMAILVANIAILVVQPIIGFGWRGFFIKLALSVFAGIVCWFLFRGLLAHRDMSKPRGE